LRTAYIAPPELLLDAPEVAALWAAETGAELTAGDAAGLAAMTDGWLRPLRLAASGLAGELPREAREILRLAPVRWFLRTEVLPAYAPADLERIAGDGGLLAETALGVEEAGRFRPPLLLGGWLAEAEPLRQAAPDPAAVPRPVVRVSLFGKPGVRRPALEREVEVRWPLRRAFQALAFLASSPDLAAGRDELIEAVWAGASDGDLDKNFHPTLSPLRRALAAASPEPLPPPLLLRDGIYQLSREIDWQIDWLRFFAGSERGQAAAATDPGRAAEHLRAAWSLYRGAFLPRVDAEWAALRRDRAEKAYAELLRTLGGLELQLGRPEAALDAFRALLAEDPLEERVHVEVMRLYASEGRRDLV